MQKVSTGGSAQSLKPSLATFYLYDLGKITRSQLLRWCWYQWYNHLGTHRCSTAGSLASFGDIPACKHPRALPMQRGPVFRG